jgi:hypothetical protein
MSRAKAQFNRPPDFTEASGPLLDKGLREKLRRFHPQHSNINLTDETFGHPADEFAALLMSEAHWAWSEMQWNRECLRKEEVYAEWKTVKKDLQATARFIRKYPGKAIDSPRLVKLVDRMWNMSRDVDVLLGIDVDVRTCADDIRSAVAGYLPSASCCRSIESLLVAVGAAEGLASNPPRRNVRIPTIATELALRIIRIFEGEGIVASSTATSSAIQCLTAIGQTIGMRGSNDTWRASFSHALGQGARIKKKVARGRKRGCKYASQGVTEISMLWGGLRKKIG